jgi:hypothetical protein
MQNKTNGKLIDTWHYRGEDEQTVPILVKLFKRTDRDSFGRRRNDKPKSSERPVYATQQVWFEVSTENPKIVLEGTDVEVLRDAIFGRLDKHFAVKWERYYKVTIRTDRPYTGLGTGFCLEYYDVEKGTTWDGRLLLRERGRRHDYQDKITEWPGEFRDNRGNLEACIPATPMTEEGLRIFTEQITTLRGKMREFIEPTKIEGFLTQIVEQRQKLLPEPDPKILKAEAKRRD